MPACPQRPAHVHATSADAPRRGLTHRDCGRLRLNQTRRPRPARTDRVERSRDSPIRAERRVPINAPNTPVCLSQARCSGQETIASAHWTEPSGLAKSRYLDSRSGLEWSPTRSTQRHSGRGSNIVPSLF
jgi:hypothetical protein